MAISRDRIGRLLVMALAMKCCGVRELQMQCQSELGPLDAYAIVHFEYNYDNWLVDATLWRRRACRLMLGRLSRDVFS